MTVPSHIVERDEKNAALAQKLALAQRGQTARLEQNAARARYAYQLGKSIEAVSVRPFDVMVEAEIELKNGEEERSLWYGHEDVEVNMPVSGGPAILAWTHPGLQAALATDLNDQEDLSHSGLNIVAVTPNRRARYVSVVPEIQGIYEPGGSVGLAATSRPAKRTGLKAVKLGMTHEQMRAFTSHMQGIMLITGAPGSGKTTIAYQRIRFLLDQQGLAESLPISYDMSGVRIFLANNNLMHYSRKLLDDELGLRGSLVRLVPDFVESYVDSIWKHKWGGRLIQRKMQRLEERGRDAVFGLMNEEHLKTIWKMYEHQIRKRMKTKSQMTWAILAKGKANISLLQDAISGYADALEPGDSGPKKSTFRIDKLYGAAGKQYEALRNVLDDRSRSKFDSEFAKWLFHAYDPLQVMHAYLEKTKYKSITRIEKGIAGRGHAENLIESIIGDLDKRQFGASDQAVIAFLLRFALPEEVNGSKRFREVPTAWPDQQPWTHLVIDEAQDLSAPEAALLTSLVDSRGALTISADFRQRVSAAHGIDDPSALLLGCKISTEGMRKPFRFAVNKRQTQQIARFLMAYYEANFGEAPPFSEDKEESVQPTPPLPELFVGSHQAICDRLKQLRNLLSRNSGATVAVIQVNEDFDEKRKIEGYLQYAGIEPIPPTKRSESRGNQWILATVEEIKGLEFDACLVFGLDNVDSAELDYNRNRAYVALSRPAFRLVLFCQEFPSLLRGVPADRYTKKDAKQ